MGNFDVRPYHDAGNVIIGEFLSPWTWDDYTQFMLRIFDLAKQTKDTAAVVINLTVPAANDLGAPQAFMRFRDMRDVLPTNLKLVVVVGIREPMRTLADAFIAVAGRRDTRAEFVDSLQEADQTVAEFLCNLP